MDNDVERRQSYHEEKLQVVSEVYGSSSNVKHFIVNSSGNFEPAFQEAKSSKTNLLDTTQRVFQSVFLPHGYPHSVSEDYLEYQLWDTVQAFCSSITGTLAAHALLKGFGVGDEKATVLAATLTFLLKDGAGMIGRILFAWAKGIQLDCDAKRWRLVADILNDGAILLDLIAPIFKGYFLLMVCLSSILKSIVGVAGGATRAALTLHQAKRDNMADVSAKDGSQETLVNLMALLAGLIITPIASGNQMLVWTLFLVFTFFHLFANYKAVSAVVMETINLPRYHILLSNYLRTGEILLPKEVAKIDPVIRRPGYRASINLGARFNAVIKSSTELHDCLSIPSAANKKFITKIAVHKGLLGEIHIILHTDAQFQDILQASFEGLLIDLVFSDTSLQVFHFSEDANQAMATLQSKVQMVTKNGMHQSLWSDIAVAAHNVSSIVYPKFEAALVNGGWDLTKCHIAVDEWRSSWNIDEIKKLR